MGIGGSLIKVTGKVTAISTLHGAVATKATLALIGGREALLMNLILMKMGIQ